MKRWTQNTYIIKKRWLAGILLLLFTTALAFSGIRSNLNQNSYKEQLIRFHVIANSDDMEDQLLKEKVRDRIIKDMDPKMARSKSILETREIIRNNIGEIEKIAKSELQKNHKNAPVTVSLADAKFPTKSYGGITLPAGEYEALKVVIGEGKGSNWWCVLFPPLCFIDMEKGLTTEKTHRKMREVLTEEEYNQIRTARSQDEIPIKLKFKVVELYHQAKSNVQKFVGSK